MSVVDAEKAIPAISAAQLDSPSKATPLQGTRKREPKRGMVGLTDRSVDILLTILTNAAAH